MVLWTEPFLFRELWLKHCNYTSASLLWGCYKPSAELAQHSLRSAQKQREMRSKNGDKATCWWQGHLSGKNICRKLPSNLNFRTFFLPTQAIGHNNSFQATCERFGFVAIAWTSLTSNIIIGHHLFNIKLALMSKPFPRFHLGLIKSNIPASISEAPKQRKKKNQTNKLSQACKALPWLQKNPDAERSTFRSFFLGILWPWAGNSHRTRTTCELSLDWVIAQAAIQELI